MNETLAEALGDMISMKTGNRLLLGPMAARLGREPASCPALQISLSVFDNIQSHAEQSYPSECCGVLLGGARPSGPVLYEALRGENVARESPTTCFQLDSLTLLHGLRHLRSRADRFLAFYHSHPNGSEIPSNEDSAHAWSRYTYVIIPVRSGRAGCPTVWVAARRPVRAPHFPKALGSISPHQKGPSRQILTRRGGRMGIQ